MVKEKPALLFGTLFCLLAVIFGAFAAHSLKAILAEDTLLSFQTGVRFQFWHGLALLLIAVIHKVWGFASFRVICNLMIIGTLFFSFSIYFLCLNHIWELPWLRIMGPVTPIGGTMLIVAWLLFLIQIIRYPNH